MPEFINVGDAAPYVVALILGLLAFYRIKPADVGSAALAGTEAAEKALRIQDNVIEDLQARVERLEAILIDREDKIERLESEIKLLDRWIAVLLEQMSKAGVPYVTLEEIRRANGINDK